MSTENIASPKPISSRDLAWTEWSDIPRFATRYQHLTRAVLGEEYRVGVAIEELPPGKQSAVAHYHIFEEEHIYMLDGAATLRLGAETHVMKAGDYVCFPAGQKAGHCLINQGSAPCRYVVLGERHPNEVSVHTDTNKVAVRALGRRAIFDLASARGYWEGEDTGLPPGERPQSDAERYVPEAPARPKPPIASGTLPWEEQIVAGTAFGGRAKHLTSAAVGKDYHVGMLIESPAPGKRLAPLHYHMGEEEHALILDGEVTLLLGEERYLMRAGDYACFPRGQKVGHAFLNSGAGPCSYLMIGERNPADVCVYPHSNKLAVSALRSRDDIFDMSATRGYWDGETE